MKIEFTLKDRNGIELNDGDKVNWCCENIPVEECIFMGGVMKMWNSGEVIPGKLVFYKTTEEVDSMFKKTETFLDNPDTNYNPADTARLELMFFSDRGDITWAIMCPSGEKDFRHSSLEKIVEI